MEMAYVQDLPCVGGGLVHRHPSFSSRMIGPMLRLLRTICTTRRNAERCTLKCSTVTMAIAVLSHSQTNRDDF